MTPVTLSHYFVIKTKYRQITCKITDLDDHHFSPFVVACRTTTSALHTSLRCLETLALARRPFSFVIKDRDGEVVDAVRLEAWQTSLATIPTEHQDLLLLLRLPVWLMQAALANVVYLEERH